MRMKIFRDGLQGRISDGILVRSSMLVHDAGGAATAYAIQERFLRSLVNATRPRARTLVVAQQTGA
jgi:hypothetical protein